MLEWEGRAETLVALTGALREVKASPNWSDSSDHARLEVEAALARVARDVCPEPMGHVWLKDETMTPGPNGTLQVQHVKGQGCPCGYSHREDFVQDASEFPEMPPRIRSFDPKPEPEKRKSRSGEVDDYGRAYRPTVRHG